MATNKTTQANSNENTQPKPKKTVKYYWLKTRAYVNGNTIWGGGLYRVSEKIPRLERASSRFVEMFDGEVPEMRVHEIAKNFGVSIATSGGKLRKAEELIEEMVKTPELPDLSEE